MKTITSLVALAMLFVGLQTASAQAKVAAKPGAKPAPKPAAKAPVKASAKPAATAAKPVAKPAVAAQPEAAPAAPALISDKLAPAASTSNVLKVRVEANPITKRLVVRTDASAPTRVEVNDGSGRPVITSDIMTGGESAVLDVSQLPAGSYIVQCTSGERRGMRRVVLGQ